MAMEERQTLIREGAGLEESRLNQDFIDFLKKYSTPALMVLALIVLAYVGRMKWQERQAARMDLAYAELDAAEQAGSPEGLLAVAESHAGRGAVPILARLAAADRYLDSARSGLVPGAVTPAQGEAEKPEDALTDEQRRQTFHHAEELYTEILNQTTASGGSTTFALAALNGLAAIAESRIVFEPAGDGVEKAKTHYNRIIELAEAGGFGEEAARARKRLETLDTLKGLRPLPSEAQLYKPPPPPEATPPAVGPATTDLPVPTITPPPEQPAENPPTDPKPVEPAPGTAPEPTPNPDQPAPAPAEPPKP